MKSIRFKVIFSIMFCTILAAVLIGYYSINSSTKVAEKNAEKRMKLTASMESEDLDSMILGIEQSVDTLSSIALASMDFSKFKNNNEYVREYTESILEIVTKFGENTEGAICAYVRYNPDFTEPTSGIFLTRNSMNESFASVTPTDFSTFDKDDLAHVGWYYIPVENKAPIWMDPYLNENINVYMISYVVPLYVDGESVGIIGMDIDFSRITDKIKDIQIYDTGYAFLVNKNNDIMFHNELEIGTNLSVLEEGSLETFLQELKDEKNVGELSKYTYNGSEKSQIYSILENGMRLVLTVPENEINADATALTKNIFGFVVIVIILASIVGIFIGSNISKPIKKMTKVLKQTAEFDFRSSDVIDKLTKHKDEIGIMACGVKEMRASLRDVANTMTQVKDTILGNVDNLDMVMGESNRVAEDNSATTEELAAGMQETAANASMITGSVEDVKNRSEKIFELTEKGKISTDEVSVRARKLGATTVSSSEKTVKIFAEMQEKTEIAMEQSKSVEKINELTANIKEISEQTNLLALNANIEAARAGEAGRGFAIVATEIGSLSDQTFKAVEDINGIVSEVTNAVLSMSDCVKMLMEFLENTVLTDYSMFKDVGVQYQKDAETVIRIINGIDDSMGILNERINDISEGMESIGTTVEQAAEGINIIAEQSTVTVEKTADGYQQLHESREKMHELSELMEKFITE